MIADTLIAVLLCACALLAHALQGAIGDRRRAIDRRYGTHARMLRYRNERDTARRDKAALIVQLAQLEEHGRARLDPPPLQGVLTSEMRMRFRIWPN